jgi:hypothetical protein
MFILNGNVFPLPSLSPEMNQAIMKLHEAFLGNSAYDWSDLEKAAVQFFSIPEIDHKVHDKYFSCFTVLWRRWLQQGQFDQAERIWEMALLPVNKWEEGNVDRFIHKGTAYYFWGMTALLRGNIDKGYALMHQAVEEDKRTTGLAFPKSPATALVTLDTTEENQAFRDWVVTQGRYLNTFLASYRDTYQKQLKLEDLQVRYLTQPPSIDAGFLLAYVLGRLIKLDNVPNFALQNDFISQLQLNLLFDLTLVIDAAIKTKNQTGQTFIHHATYISTQANLGITQQQLSAEINGAFKGSYDIVLNALLDNSFVLNNGAPVVGLARDLSVTYGIRNRGAHNISNSYTVRSKFHEILQSVFNTFFIVVDTLY